MIAKAGEAQKHISNEWADELCNAYVTMQNIKDGITTKGHWGADGVHGHDFLNSPTAFANSTTADTAD